MKAGATKGADIVIMLVSVLLVLAPVFQKTFVTVLPEKRHAA
jgi:hypothetical protein